MGEGFKLIEAVGAEHMLSAGAEGVEALHWPLH
jgi:hypothetical protein